LIIAGNSLCITDVLLEDCDEVSKGLNDVPEAHDLRLLDFFIADLTKNTSIVLMPGDKDPAMEFLPQQAMHNLMFPNSSRSSKFHLATNPYRFILLNKQFLGTSGQNITNIKLFSNHSSISAMKLTLLNRNISPSAPSTMAIFPFRKVNPLIFTEIPHVYFCANQEGFGQSYISGMNRQKTLLVSIPDFSETKVVTLINVDMLYSKMKKFN